MTISAQDALVYLMVVAAAANEELTSNELDRIGGLVDRLPVFAGYGRENLANAASACVELMKQVDDLERILDMALASLPDRLHDTAYALAVEVAAVDLELDQQELRWLEMMRDALHVDRLTTAAIEAAARARLRRL